MKVYDVPIIHLSHLQATGGCVDGLALRRNRDAHDSDLVFVVITAVKDLETGS